MTIHSLSYIMLNRLVWTERAYDGDSSGLKSYQCQCVFYELSMKNHVPSYKMASISDFSEVRPDTFWSDPAISVSIGCGQSRPHFKEWFVVDGVCHIKLCGVNKTCHAVRGLWHYLRMGKMITFMKQHGIIEILNKMTTYFDKLLSVCVRLS